MQEGGLGWGFFDCNNMPILSQIVRPELRATGYGVMNLVSISCGGFADWGFGLFRSDKEAQKHRGITYFMFDLRSPGVTVRPIAQLDGEPGFAELFLEDVFVPDDPADPANRSAEAVVERVLPGTANDVAHELFLEDAALAAACGGYANATYTVVLGAGEASLLVPVVIPAAVAATPAATTRKRLEASEHVMPIKARMPAKPRPHDSGTTLARAMPTSEGTCHASQLVQAAPQK